MRTSGRITSAKGYKIFVTLDKGCEMTEMTEMTETHPDTSWTHPGHILTHHLDCKDHFRSSVKFFGNFRIVLQSRTHAATSNIETK